MFNFVAFYSLIIPFIYVCWWNSIIKLAIIYQMLKSFFCHFFRFHIMMKISLNFHLAKITKFGLDIFLIKNTIFTWIFNICKFIEKKNDFSFIIHRCEFKYLSDIKVTMPQYIIDWSSYFLVAHCKPPPSKMQIPSYDFHTV